MAWGGDANRLRTDRGEAQDAVAPPPPTVAFTEPLEHGVDEPGSRLRQSVAHDGQHKEQQEVVNLLDPAGKETSRPPSSCA